MGLPFLSENKEGGGETEIKTEPYTQDTQTYTGTSLDIPSWYPLRMLRYF